MKYLRTINAVKITCAVILAMAPVLSSSATPNINPQELQSIIQEQLRQEQLQEDRFEQFKQERNTTKDIFSPASVPITSDVNEPDGTCFYITAINVFGSTLLKQTDIKSVTDTYVKQCLDIATVQSIAKQLTALYISKGYITSQFSIPEQNLKLGKLKYVAIEGYVDDWEIQPDANDHLERRLRYALPLKKKGALNLRATEQALESLSRVRSATAKIDMLPGQDVGGTTLAFKIEEQKPWRVIANLDNNGSESSGEWQGRLTGEWDNPLNINDKVSLSLNGNADAGEPSSSEALSLHYSFPINYWLFEFNVNRSQYDQKVNGQISAFNTSGTTDTFGLTIKRLVYRDTQQKITLFTSVNHKDSNNFVEDTKVDVSSNRLSNISVGATWAMQSNGASYDASLSYLKGTTWLGALDDDEQPSGSPQAQGDKTSFSAGYARGVSVFKQALQYSLRGQWQFSGDAIFNSEHISLGSLFTVRGFKESRVSSNRGGYVRQEVSLPIKIERFAPLGITPYWGLDWGRVHLSANQWEEISGTALGFKAAYKALNVDISASHAIDQIKGVQGESTLYHVSLNYTF